MGNLKKKPSSANSGGVKRDRNCGKRPPVLSSRAVDGATNALLCAFLSDLGLGGVLSPSTVGRLNQRKNLLELDPVQLVGVEFDGDPSVFTRLHVAAHSLDRYFYHDELSKEYQGRLDDKAFNGFIDLAILGKEMNDRLRGPFTGDAFTRLVLNEAALICQRILGPIEAEEVFAEVGHGPNATTTLKRLDAYPWVKYANFAGSERVLEMFWGDYLLWDTNLHAGLLSELILLFHWFGPEWADQLDLETVHEWSRLEFVEKKWNARRAITPQPTLNMFFQLGLGRVLIQRLSRAGINISDQQECHRLLVRLASLYPEIDIASVDWSEASNRLWLSIAERVFPHDWYWWFTELRTSYASKDGMLIEVPFVGEMGNGFTFPFQTLLFYCVLRAVCEFGESAGLCSHSHVSIFGDDCLVATGALPLLAHLAEDLQWKLNVTKTFGHGGFRESCGEDCFRGRSCRPVFLGRPDSLTSVNSLRTWAYTQVNGLRQVLQREGLDTLEVDLWLKEFHIAIGKKRICVVPLHYPETAGLRLGWSRVSTLSPEAYHVPRLVRAGDKEFPEDPGALAFRALSAKVPRMVPWWFPYYHLALRCHVPPVDQDWSILHLDPVPAVSIDGIPRRGSAIHYHELTRLSLEWDRWLS